MFLQFERDNSKLEVFVATEEQAIQYKALYEGMDFALVNVIRAYARSL